MISHREVRFAEAFFDKLDAELGSERGPGGEPSATDLLVIDLPPVVERPRPGS